MTKLAVKIAVLESEKGWGSKIDDWMVCLNIEDALLFKSEFNAENDLEQTPDWYMMVIDEPVAINLTDGQYEYLLKENRVWLSDMINIL